MSIYNLIMEIKKLNAQMIGKNVRRIRKELNETQEKFAEGIGVCKDTVSNIERGEVIPSAQVLANMSINAKISINLILGIDVPEVKK